MMGKSLKWRVSLPREDGLVVSTGHVTIQQHRQQATEYEPSPKCGLKSSEQRGLEPEREVAGGREASQIVIHHTLPGHQP